MHTAMGAAALWCPPQMEPTHSTPPQPVHNIPSIGVSLDGGASEHHLVIATYSMADIGFLQAPSKVLTHVVSLVTTLTRYVVTY